MGVVSMRWVWVKSMSVASTGADPGLSVGGF